MNLRQSYGLSHGLSFRQALDAGRLIRPRPPPLRSPLRAKKDKEESVSLSDDLLDFAMAGQKMRKWYGAPERSKKATKDDPSPEDDLLAPLPPSDEPSESTSEPNDMVLVTDADTPIGEQVILRLILSRVRVKALVADTTRARAAYGDFVSPISIDLGSQNAARGALKGCGAIISLGKLGALDQVIASRPDSIHLILLSTMGALTPPSKPWSSIFKGTMAGVGQLSDESREARAGRIECCTVVRVDASSLNEVPGARSAIEFIPQGDTGTAAGAYQGWERELGNEVSCEDLAAVLVASLQHPPPLSAQEGTSNRSFQVISKGKGSLPSDWEGMFNKVSI